jgi:hypothetical protein
LVAKEGQIIYQNTFGLANVEFDIPMQKDITNKIKAQLLTKN